MIVDVAQWSRLDSDAAEKVAKSIAVRSGATLVEVQAHEYAGRRGLVAVFVAGGERFAFVPGGEVTAGFDGDRFEPTPQQEASFADSADEYRIEGDIRQFTDSVTSRRPRDPGKPEQRQSRPGPPTPGLRAWPLRLSRSAMPATRASAADSRR